MNTIRKRIQWRRKRNKKKKKRIGSLFERDFQLKMQFMKGLGSEKILPDFNAFSIYFNNKENTKNSRRNLDFFITFCPLGFLKIST